MKHQKASIDFVCLAAQSCPTLCNPMDCSPPACFVHVDSPGKNTGGLHALLQGDLPNPGIEPRSLTLQVDSLLSEPPGKPIPSPGDLPNPVIEPGSPALQADSLPAEPTRSYHNQISYHNQELVRWHLALDHRWQ